VAPCVNQPSEDRVVSLLTSLMALPTVNPMGRPYEGPFPVERPVVELLERLFAPFGVKMQRQPCSLIHESLLITIPGAASQPGTLLEAHVDTVPAEDWADRAFLPRVADGRVYGRGACDNKGSLAAMVLALLQLLESGKQPSSTIWLLAAGDEEYAQCGIRYFMSQQPGQIGRAVIGEPTEVAPVIQQKGVLRWDITVQGRSAHSSMPEHGRNAILDMTRVMEELSRYERELQSRHVNPLMTGPTLSVTMIHGGHSRNAVPYECTIAVDFRPLPEMDRHLAMGELKQRLQALDLQLTHHDFQCNVPGLNTSADDPFVQRVLALCSTQLGRNVAAAGVPYGSDACWMPPGVPTIVLGPGDIAQAHAIEEYVAIEQVQQCAAVYYDILCE
jgi:acetylornithine deacetylase